MALTQNFTDNFFPRIEMRRMSAFESRNALETAMAGAGEGAGMGGAGVEEESHFSPQDMGLRALRMLEGLVAGRALSEVAADEGLTPRRARELMAEAVAQRGYDP